MENCLEEESLWDYKEGVTFAVSRTNEGAAQMCTVNICFESETDSASQWDASMADASARDKYQGSQEYPIGLSPIKHILY